MPVRGTRLATIQLKGWVKQIIEAVCTDIKKSTDAIGLRTSGVIRLPARRERWSILRSPFVHKKSQEQASAIRCLLWYPIENSGALTLVLLLCTVPTLHAQPPHRDIWTTWGSPADAFARRDQDGSLPTVP